MRCLLILACWLCAFAAAAQPLPPAVDAALARAHLPREAVTLLVTEADGTAPPRLSHRADVPVNPASIAKLATTFAALELLGPTFTWTTPVYADGPIVGGTLQGNLYLRGQGDPTLVLERLWLLLRRVRALGIDRIAGDIVLDHGAFELAPHDAGAFDGEPLRPYNAAPDALLLNYRTVVLTFLPQADGSARVVADPPLTGVQWPRAVRLAGGDCGDWRAALQADFSAPLQPRLAGAYPAACGERRWPLAFADPASHAARLVAGLWQESGAALGGQVRDGTVPAHLAPLFEQASPPLSEVVRDVNKFSNNVMAQQLFLTLSLQAEGRGSREASREILRNWWRERIGPQPPVFDNGAGLSRDARISAAQLARLLQHAWASPLMPELLASLPLSGSDGTLRRLQAPAQAHLKSGSLRDVFGVAGYVHGTHGRRWVVVAIANHPNAGAMRPAIEALLAWTARQP
ncbi:D-alanyl-D-alanine carboxypeptidase/D-alanyl-D-alanine-endopeptidase [Ramlibacter tataouinensis]|uniref:D-alanyl-D-alanine carboxypeptidase/D-alanyl-D-alanine endopeptidase n=1 Tax=Ramlibacter tataouinensis TaxID=94132 RepID=UPI0022F3AB92|nr:D-alanyl-D-alanine carboxypeptidase/D-alanyl-D-alanine-endopeptidase [Ramlibacter tataouinensis]WBY00158.1 D-alanyl-D-alanine carboxypeptidase/D-alanyl-D-alanine-endopeptidase [Ramlibacter tataouinensis]